MAASRLASRFARPVVRTVAIVTLLAGLALQAPAALPDPYRVLVHAAVSDGAVMEVFFNDFQQEPLRLPIRPNAAHPYDFRSWPEGVTRLRLDPTTSAGASVRLDAVEIRRGDALVRAFAAADLAGWACEGFGPPVPAGHPRITVTSDPQCVSPAVNLPPPGDATLRAGLIRLAPGLVMVAALLLVAHLVAWGGLTPAPTAPRRPGWRGGIDAAAREAPLALAWAAAGAVVALHLGQDLNFDLRLYHFYNPYALLHDRIGVDVHAAGRQSFHNPLFDLPFYLGARVFAWPPVAVGLAQGAWHGLNLWLVHRIVRSLLAGRHPAVAWGAGAIAAGTATFGAAFYGEVGTTFGDATFSVFVLAGLAALLAAVARRGPSRRRWTAAAGLLVGLAAGGKVVAIAYAAGLAAAATWWLGSTWRERLGSAVAAGFGGLAGVAVSGGYWMALMQRHFGNPLFPFSGGLFGSPYPPAVRFSTIADWYGPDSPFEAVFLPFLFTGTRDLAGVPAFRDFRLAAVVVAVLALAVTAAWARLAGRRGPSPGIGLVATFTGVSYVAWLAAVPVYRFAVPLELLAPVVAAGALTVVRRSALLIAATAALAAGLVATTRPIVWERIPWSDSHFGVDPAPLAAYRGATMLIWGEPNGYVLPYFPTSTIFVRPDDLAGGPRPGTRMFERLEARIRTASALHTLETGAWTSASESRLRSLGLRRDETACRLLPTHAAVHRMCAVERVRP